MDQEHFAIVEFKIGFKDKRILNDRNIQKDSWIHQLNEHLNLEYYQE